MTLPTRIRIALLAVCALLLMAPAAFAHHTPNDVDHDGLTRA